MAPVNEDEPKVPHALPTNCLKFDAAYQNKIVDDVRRRSRVEGWDFDDEAWKGQWLANGQLDLYSLDSAIRLIGEKGSKVAKVSSS